jgi:signal transduction histidine kinase
MSHDLRTPLNGILGFTDIALKEPTRAETGISGKDQAVRRSAAEPCQRYAGSVPH